MKTIVTFILLFWTTCQLVATAQPLKVACIGNSITYGAGIANREKNAYPAQLQAYLGKDYIVQNFGVNARTLLHNGDLPYTQAAQYKQSLDFNPDIVIIKLGTNDAKPQNKGHLVPYFKADYQALIDSYKALPSHPRIILATPVRCYLSEEQFSSQAYEQIVIPTLEQLAFENNIELINLYSLFDTHWDSSLLPDKLHPSSIGAGQMAAKIGRVISRPVEPFNILSNLPVGAPKTSDFHGYACYDFNDSGVDGKIVAPRRVATGRPWVWRARFWGHEPQTDIALLENGFHVVYCDVADLYGSPEAVKRWNRCYTLVTNAGLNQKVALEGMSRGGLIIYNWAARNPSKVACIYADAPVMDFKSWPMGTGESAGSEGDTKTLLTAYSFGSKQDAMRWKHNPVDHAKGLAQAKIPMLHVVGDADDVVPVEENTAVFEQAVRKYNGEITVIHKPNIGHHPHSLAAPDPIVRFILNATGQYENPCVRAVPGNEYRSGAGWTEGSDWHAVAEEITQLLASKTVDLLLIGNSITQGFAGNRTLVTYKPGRHAADSVFGALTWEAAGISGDRTQHLLWRLQNGNYNACRPRTVVITIGINNLTTADTPDQVAQGMIAVATEASKQFPLSHIILLGTLPAGATANNQLRQKCDQTHARLSKIKFPANVQYINPTPWFVDDEKNLQKGLYSGDHLHLSAQGYVAWCTQLVKLIK